MYENFIFSSNEDTGGGAHLAQIWIVLGQVRSHGWHRVVNATSKQQGVSLLPPQGVFLQLFLLLLFLVAKERFPKIVVELNVGHCVTLESSIFSCTYIIHLILMTRSMEKVLRFCAT